ncbi:BMP family ABC transporter substrate-binding protein [Nocardioides phosphati]|uniref:BMP family ABC transporter substrate-binding protein n=1 Tax=Nocardioides phosphati TaxID=1867775 RepID=A0ABQ2N4P8_9ACTN|nr:BMP family ABC transporter substrate-binding protein [Nocardioides phosphati]GGO84488.1 BMP family ABC transporter substrate-binding protein [Nocardioides phosphati]
MRNVSKIAAVGLVASLALTGCGKKHEDTASSGSKDVCSGFKDSSPVKLAIAFDVGGRGDHSFNDAAYAGAEKAVSDLGASCIDAQATVGETDAQRADRLKQLADKGATAIVGVGYLYSTAVNQVAQQYPKVNFLVVDGYDPDKNANANVAYDAFAPQESSYLAGVAAALKTKTKNVGVIGAVPGAVIDPFMAGYKAGVHAVDPKIEVQSKYIVQSGDKGFNDPTDAKQIAQQMLDNGADVIFHAAGLSGAGLFEAVAAAGDGKWAIGVDGDQYGSATKEEQPHILTSALKRVDTGVYDFAASVKDGKPQSSYVTYNLKNDGVALSYSGGFLDDVKSKIDAYATKIENGQIKVPTDPKTVK